MVGTPPLGLFGGKTIRRRRRKRFKTEGASHEAPFNFVLKCRTLLFQFPKHIAVWLLFSLFPTGVPLLSDVSEAGMRGPWEPPSMHDATPIPPDFSPSQKMLMGAVRFFQKRISPIDGARCGFHPSCSAYASEAVSTYGPIEGVLMTADRLMRCSPWKEFEAHYPKAPDGRFYDPPISFRTIQE